MRKSFKNYLSLLLMLMMALVMVGIPSMATDISDATDVIMTLPVATIGDNNYAYSLQDAVNKGETVTLLRDVELTEALTISAGKTIILDLNGKTVSYNSTTQGEAMITNKGTLTINDSSNPDTGEIYYNYTGAADPSYGKGNYTISNAGTLTVNGGKIHIANLKAHAKYPIDNNSTSGDAVLVINDGHLYNYNTSAIRQFCNSTTNKNSVTINGGLIEGYCAIWVQNPGKNTVNGTLSITGGEIKTTAAVYVNGTSELKDVASRIYCTIDGDGGAWSKGSSVSITGGTINENVNLAEEAPANITTAGTANFNGYVEVPAPAVTYVAEVNDVQYTDLQEAIKAAAPSGTVEIIADVTVDKWITISETLTIGDGTIITLAMDGLTIDGNDHTITIKEIESPEREDYLFGDATELHVKDLTIKCIGSDAYDGGISLKSGTISNVTFEGGKYAVLPGNGDVTITGCTFKDTTGYAIYYEDARDNLKVDNNFFNTASGAYSITMRGKEQFTTNIINTGKVNIANSSSAIVSGNNFGAERFKVYNGATATISGNTINNLVFNDGTVAKATFTDDNILSESAQAALDAVTAPSVIDIYDWEDLKELDALVEDGNMLEGVTVKLMNDIDLHEMGTGGEPVTFNPIGANKAYFKGTFDGQGHTIKNMYQSGWALGYDWDNYGTIGLFAYIWNATIKNLTIENAECLVEGGSVAGIAGCAWGDCTFENITIKNSTYATYNNRAAGIVGYTGGEGTMTFKDITVDKDTVIAGLWGSFDSSLGGVVGSIQDPTKHVFKNVTVACRLDAYNDVTAAYQYYAYRMCGMLIGKIPVDGNNQPILDNVTIGENVTIDYSNTPDYAYVYTGSGSKSGWNRVEAGYAYDGVDLTQHPDAEVIYKPFNSMFGGQQYGSYGQDDHEDIIAEGRVAAFDGDYFTSLETAIKVADGAKDEEGNAIPVKLMADYSGDIVITEFLKLDPNGYSFTGEVTTIDGYEVVYEDDKYTVVQKAIFSSGTGTENDPYIITNLDELKAFRDSVNAGKTYEGKYIKLTADIDLTGKVWIPIGTSIYDKTPSDPTVKMFAGNFDGGNHTITGLSSNGYVPDSAETDSKEYSFGLFGYVYGANISNVKLAYVDINCGTRKDSANIDVGGSGVAALIGYYYVADGKECVIENCHVLSGTVEASNNMGGLIGFIDSQISTPQNVNITIKDCSNAADVISEAREAGGIVGLLNASRKTYAPTMAGTITFENCTNIGDITTLGGGGTTFAGGILGKDQNEYSNQQLKIIFDGCTNSGVITVHANGETNVAGIATSMYSHGAWLVVKNSSNTGNVKVVNPEEATLLYAGGLLGYAGVMDVLDSTSTGTVTVGDETGNKYIGDVQNMVFVDGIDDFNAVKTGYTYYLNGGISPEFDALVDDPDNWGGNFTVLVKTAYSKEDGCDFLGWYDITGNKYTALNNNVKHYYAKWSRVAKIGDILYETVSEALTEADAGDTVKLISDSVESLIMVPAGVTLDLNGKTLEANYVVAFGGFIVDNSAENTGRLATANASFTGNNPQIPVKTDAGYMFAEVTKMNQMYVANYTGSGKKYVFQPILEEAVYSSITGDSNVSFEVRLAWRSNDYSARQDFVYNEKFVETFMAYYTGATTSKKVFSVILHEVWIKSAENMTINFVIKANGVEYNSNIMYLSDAN